MKKFELEKFVSASVASLSAYVPGEQPQERGWVKLNTNEFPYPPSHKAAEAVMSEIGGDAGKLRLYPDPISANLRAGVAKYFGCGLTSENVIATNGSDDLLNIVVRAFSDEKKSVAALDPSYSLYPVLTQMQGAEFIEIAFDKGLEIPFEKIANCGANLFFMTNPNAPTAKGFSKIDIIKILENFKGIVVVDEAYAPFSDWTAVELVANYPNLIVAGTMSKGWGLAGMRVGWGIANKAIIGILDRVRDSYNLDRLAQVSAVAALKDKSYYENFRAKVIESRQDLENFLVKLGWDFVKSSANFIFVRPARANGKSGVAVAKDLFEFLKGGKILVRYFPKIANIADGLRVTIGTPTQMKKFKNRVLEWLATEKE